MNYNEFKRLIETAMSLGFKTVAELCEFKERNGIETNGELLSTLEASLRFWKKDAI